MSTLTKPIERNGWSGGFDWDGRVGLLIAPAYVIYGEAHPTHDHVEILARPHLLGAL